MPSKARSALAVAGAGLAAALTFGATPALAAYTAQVSNGTLQVTGNSANDALALRLAPGDPQTLQLDVGDDGTADFAFDRAAFTAVDVQGGGGDDSIRIDQLNGRFTEDAVTLDGGGGNDTLTGGDGADVLLGNSGNDVIDGNRGTDDEHGGTGNDTFLWDPGDGSDTLAGDGGADALQFNGSNIGEQIDLSAVPGGARLTRDVAAVTQDLDDVDDVDVAAQAGTDQLTVNDLTGSGVGFVGMTFAPDASAPDTVIENGTPRRDKVNVIREGDDIFTVGFPAETRITGAVPADTLAVNTLDGLDSVFVAPEVSQLITPVVDLGAGQ